MLQLVPPRPAHATTARSHCPDCNGALAVLRVIPGGAKLEASSEAKPETKSETRSEYWTMRCTKCGGIHLDILKAKSILEDKSNLEASQPRPVQVSEDHPA
jgi:Zn finger protein HypA/HybF involved in hydrogenase expression